VYTEFFGLNDKPFSISPDPRYLYLSRRHADALAHLIYGISESGGFIQLTGEVGTGKTTLIRSLLEQLPEKAEIALILNPQLSTKEFLQSICEELRIAAPGAFTVKDLIDRLNSQLLQAHAEDRRIVLIVDEAQTLSPELLEQVRLLTNLETTRKKLLQIILIGQPELRELLDRPQMRQIAQRVTGRYHLEPLNLDDALLYVDHRMRVAGAQTSVFTRSAVREIFRQSRGIPRLINVVADRALLAAYTQDRSKIDRKLVRRAAAEVFGKRLRRPWWPWAAALTGLAAFALTTTTILQPPVSEPADTASLQVPAETQSDPLEDETALAPVTLAPAGTAAPAAAVLEPADSDSTTQSLVDLLAQSKRSTTMGAAMGVLFSLWGLEYQAARGPACQQAKQAGLSCLFFSGGSIGQLRRINRPVILTLSDAGGADHRVVMSGLDYDHAQMTLGAHTHEVSVIELTHQWYGEHLLLWRPAINAGADLVPGERNEGVRWLRQSLANIRGTANPDPESSVYDAALQGWVREYQRDRKLAVDGIVGARTQISIATDLGLDGVPLLDRTN
jgi:general secretion pathway protein A